jgi:hypothetical protein
MSLRVNYDLSNFIEICTFIWPTSQFLCPPNFFPFEIATLFPCHFHPKVCQLNNLAKPQNIFHLLLWLLSILAVSEIYYTEHRKKQNISIS